jgi:hypothetical protein
MGVYDEKAARWGGQFEPVTSKDAEVAQAAHAAVMEAVTRRQEAVVALRNLDPSLVYQATQLIQAEVAKRLGAEVAA